MKGAAELRRKTRLIGRHSFTVGGFRISTYALLLYLGCVAGTIGGCLMAQSRGVDATRFALTTIVLLIPALVGARLWFVLQHIEMFRAEPRRIWRRGDGGASLYGGLVLSVAASPAVLRLTGLPFWSFWDATSVTMLVGLVIARFGCLMNGCCVGRVTSGPMGVSLPDYRGEWQRRLPSQLFESGWAAIVLVAVLAARHVLVEPGTLFAVSTGAYAFGRLLIEPTRETVRPARTTYLNLAVSAVVVAMTSALLLYRWWR